MEFGILGPTWAVTGDGRPVELDGTKQRTLLAALLLARGRVLADSRLMALLWGGDPPVTVRAQLYTYVSRLRARLAPQVRIVRRPPGYLLDTGTGRLDADEFARLARLGHADLTAGRYAPAARRLRAALDLWRGLALADTTEFLREAAAPELDETRMAALEGRIEADLALGAHARLVPELTGLVAAHPLRERLRAQLVVALHRSQRRGDALVTYHEGRRILADEMGIVPGPALAGALRRVLRGEPGAHRLAGCHIARPADPRRHAVVRAAAGAGR
jgi:DNA-binding SARP family transcriptional activator